MLNAQEVRQLYEGWVSALCNSSRKALDVICDANFTWTDCEGRYRDKPQTLDAVSAGDIVYESWSSSEHRVRFFGNCAVLNCRDRLTRIDGGRSMYLDQRSISVFFRQDSGAWKLVGTQSTRAEPAPMADA